MSTAGVIPDWNAAGILPPIRPEMLGSSTERSPYRVSLESFVERFATSPERNAILSGLLRFRGELHNAGIVAGFQWLDGSFLERIEDMENRPPRDMDVVTFYNMPTGEDQQSLYDAAGQVFDREHLETTYKIDSYFIELGKPVDTKQVKRIAYWYSMWSHRRDGLWKGFVQVDLDLSEDIAARAILKMKGDTQHE